jgi:hypothetical protein
MFFEGRPLTTKGRFINPGLKLLYRLLCITNTRKIARAPAFILGTGRSGTTILGISLSTHKNVSFLNEPKLPWYFANDKDDLIGSYSSDDGQYILRKEDVTDRIRNRITTVYHAYEKFTNAKLILDKYPEMIFRTAFIEEIFPRSKYIFLCRNGLDIVHSIADWSQRKSLNSANDTRDWWGLNDRKWRLLVEQVVCFDEDLSPLKDIIKNYTSHKDRASIEWIVTMKQGLELVKQKKLDVLLLKYEDFVAKESARLELISFLGLEHDPEYLSYCNTALKKPSVKSEIYLPLEIKDIFNTLQTKLGYLDHAKAK